MFNIHFSIEHWKWNPDFELYVSDRGRFRSRDKREVPIQIGQGGYCWVYCGGTTHKHLLAHRVVMLTWRPTPNAEHLTVDHLNHNKRDNSLANLEWVTKAENIRRAKADELNIVVEGNPAMVEKVDVSIISKVESAPTKYKFYLKLNGSTIISVEDFANLFFSVYGKNSLHHITKRPCADIAEFCTMVAHKAKAKPDKFFGFQMEIVPKNEGADNE